MNTTRSFTFICFCLIFFISFTSSAKKEEMKLHLIKGQHYTYVITQESTIIENPMKEALLNQRTSLKISQQVTAILGNGNYQIEASFESFNLVIKSNGKITRYDSDTINVMNKYYKILKFINQIKLNYEVSPDGVVSKLTGFETIKKNIESDPELSTLLRNFGSEQFIMELYNYIPLKNVGVGDNWIGTGILPDMMNLKYDIHFTLKEVSSQNLKINKEASFNYSIVPSKAISKTGLVKETGTQKGILNLDPRTRLCLSSNLDQHILIIRPDPEKPTDEKDLPINITTHTKMQLVKK